VGRQQASSVSLRGTVSFSRFFRAVAPHVVCVTVAVRIAPTLHAHLLHYLTSVRPTRACTDNLLLAIGAGQG